MTGRLPVSDVSVCHLPKMHLAVFPKCCAMSSQTTKVGAHGQNSRWEADSAPAEGIFARWWSSCMVGNVQHLVHAKKHLPASRQQKPPKHKHMQKRKESFSANSTLAWYVALEKAQPNPRSPRNGICIKHGPRKYKVTYNPRYFPRICCSMPLVWRSQCTTIER